MGGIVSDARKTPTDLWFSHSMVMLNTEKERSMSKSAGRPRTASPTAVQTALSRWLDKHWDELGLTNERAAAVLGFRAPNTVSMWRTGRTAVPLGRIVQLANLFKIDPMQFVILWLDQQEVRDPDFPPGIASLARKRLASANEQVLLDAIRVATKSANPEWGRDKIDRVVSVLAK